MYQELRYEVEDPIATITFDRPDRLNAMTNRMTDELKHAVAQAEADERVVAIVLTGAGRGFCAGADLQGLKAIGYDGYFTVHQAYAELMGPREAAVRSAEYLRTFGCFE